MNAKDIKTLYRLYHTFENEVYDVFSDLCKNKKLKARFPTIRNIDIDQFDERIVKIKYEDIFSSNEIEYIEIPTKILGNPELTKEFVESIC